MLLQKVGMKLADAFFSMQAQPTPDLEKLESCKIISHRGENDNHSVLENTLAAFDRVVDTGVWGVECDFRWTKDLHPVVIHDKNCQRLFNSDIVINQVTLRELKNAIPIIPTLEELVQRYGKKLHLMVEIKAEYYPNPGYQERVLEKIFAHLTPCKDYHFLSLENELFDYLQFIPRNAFLLVAGLNTKSFSQIALERGYGGLTGHYSLLDNTLLTQHKSAGQYTGTGFVASKSVLFREINRGVDWIFSNRAIRLQSIVDQYLGNESK